MKTIAPALFVTFVATCALAAQDKTDAKPVQQASAKKAKTPKALVTAAMLDYVEAIYDVRPERIARTVAKSLDKVGIVEKDGKLHEPSMSYKSLHKLAANYNKGGVRIPEDAPKKVEVLDVLPHIAVAKLTAAWGIDYIQMARTKKGWQIEQITWQRPERPLADAKKTHAAVKAAALGYIDAFYKVEPKLIDQHVHPELAKYGNYHGRWMKMNHAQLKSLAGNAFKGQQVPANAPKKVEILDCANNTAAVKVTGLWGIDYMNLVRTAKGWKIRQVIWQTHPPKHKAPKKAAK